MGFRYTQRTRAAPKSSVEKLRAIRAAGYAKSANSEPAWMSDVGTFEKWLAVRLESVMQLQSGHRPSVAHGFYDYTS